MDLIYITAVRCSRQRCGCRRRDRSPREAGGDRQSEAGAGDRHVKIKTDTIDADVLAQLYASGFLPKAWIANEATQGCAGRSPARNQIVRQRTRLKNIMHSILHAHLIPACPHQDLCGPKGRAWLGEQVLPANECLAMQRHLREFDRLGEDQRFERPQKLVSYLGLNEYRLNATPQPVATVQRFRSSFPLKQTATTRP